MSKTTQRRAVVAILGFALGAASTIPAFAANDGMSAVPNYVDSLGDTLYDLPFVSYLPGQEVLDETTDVVDGAMEGTGEFVDDAAAGGGIVGGLGGIVGGLPLVGGLVSGGGGGLPIVGGLPVVGGLLGGGGGGLPIVGGLPLVGGIVNSLPIVGGGGSASIAPSGDMVSSLPVVGPMAGGLVSNLPVVGGVLGGGGAGLPVVGGLPIVGGLLGSLTGGAGGLLGGVL